MSSTFFIPPGVVACMSIPKPDVNQIWRFKNGTEFVIVSFLSGEEQYVLVSTEHCCIMPHTYHSKAELYSALEGAIFVDMAFCKNRTNTYIHVQCDQCREIYIVGTDCQIPVCHGKVMRQVAAVNIQTDLSKFEVIGECQ